MNMRFYLRASKWVTTFNVTQKTFPHRTCVLLGLSAFASLTNFKSKVTSQGKFLRPRPTFRTVEVELRRSTFNPITHPPLFQAVPLAPRAAPPTPHPPWYWPRGETREPDLLRRRPDELCFSALGTDVMPRIMLFSTNRHIPLKIMYVLITVQVKSAPLAAAAPHQFHRVSPVGGGEGEF